MIAELERTTDGLVELLQQTDVWVARHRDDYFVTHRLDDMHARHQRAVLAHLRRRAAELHERHGGWLTRQAVALGALGVAAVPALVAHNRTDPHVWLDETPLVRRLVELVGREPALPPRGLRRRRRSSR